jgi:hypothetical protein
MYIYFTETGAPAIQEFIDLVQEKLVDNQIPFDNVYFSPGDNDDSSYKHKVVEVNAPFTLSSGTGALERSEISENVFNWLISL